MRLCVTLCAVLLCAGWLVQADLSRRELQRAVRAAKACVDSAYETSKYESQSRMKDNSVSPGDVLRLMKQPTGQTKKAVLFADYLNAALSDLHAQCKRLSMSRAPEHHSEIELSDLDMEDLIAASGCSRVTTAPPCEYIPNLHKYRTADSVCNNLENPLWGASNGPLLRQLPAEYQDGFSLPKGWDPDVLVNGHKLPLVRAVSTHILATGNMVINDGSFSMLLTLFGQWITHDITLTPITPVTRSYNSSSNCEETCERAEPCFPIKVPRGDSRLTRGECMPFVRSSPACTGGQVRQQINAITAFVDMGQVYGADHVKALALRDFDSDKGLLRVNQEYNDNGRELLHFSPMTGNICATRRRMTGDGNAKEVPCFQAGDSRANENIALTAMHTLMMRQHNRLARKLSELNPHWDGERLYQEARKIQGAMSQVITFRDYLGHIVGSTAMSKRLSVYPGYDSEVDPSISNVFATAALRFGHLTVQPHLFRLDENYKEHPDFPSPLLHRAFFAPWRLVFEGGLDPILRGVVGRPAKLNTQQNMAPDEIRERLFKFSEELALDLASLNLQRGRDHGLPGYNTWRRFCGLSQPSNAQELGKVLRNPQLARRLINIYKTPDNIDVWLGGLAEPFVCGGRVGPLFACLIADQFRRIQQGDRLWWENEGVFTERQRRSLRDASFPRILCDNTGITEVPDQPFRYRPRGYGYTSCSNIPEMDLSPWQEKSRQGPQGPPGPPGPPGPTGPAHKVAFSARLGSSKLTKRKPIVFHEVIYNRPGHYDPRSGVFTCVVPGVYEFHVTLHIYKADVGVDLMRNDAVLLHSYNTRHSGYIMSSGSTIANLRTGDRVYVVVKDGRSGLVKDSQFSGFLLFTEDENHQ